jgi:non-ribosomal peptide synthetase-like protein
MLVCKDADNTVRWKEGERLHHYFEQRCDQVPSDHLAVITEDVTYTFRDLDNRANQAARYLLDQGLLPGDRIALLFDKSIHGYVGLLAVLKIGAAYVPLDASLPADRIDFILQDANIKAIVSVSEFASKLAEFDVKKAFLDSAEQEIDEKPTARLSDDEIPASSDQLFYIIYTSGTTGKPKGVAIEHAGICNFVKVAGEVYGIRDDDRCYQGMTLAFDFHVESLWVPLIAGATLIGGKSGANLFGNDLYEFLMAQEVTVLPCVPTLWATIEQDLPAVRIVLLSGESVPHNLVVRWHRPDRYILNAYGPTECSVSSTLRRLVPDNRVTIGVPLPTYTVVIIDEHKPEVVAEGEIGEIGIAGIALAVGYLNREELTREKFIPDFLDLPNNPSKRIYRTGDYGRIAEDGELEFHGRIDTQVKLRGYRIELGEIEAVLAQVPGISQAVVNPYEPEPGAVELVAYYTHTPGAEAVSPAIVSETLRKQLPPYMVPDYLEELSEIPMTSNDKADRKKLPAPKAPRFSVSSSTYVAPKTETEQTLTDALIEVMKLDRASIEDNFFEDLGAHSLLMARFGAEIRKRLKISSISMRDVYLNPTIEKLARHIDSLPDETSDQTTRTLNRETFHKPTDQSYYLCGALQFAWYVGWSIVSIWILVNAFMWTYAAMPDLGAVYMRIIALAVGLSVVFTIIPIAAKWLLIGKWKEEVIPIWSLRYFRFWAIKALIGSAPMAGFGDPFYNLYLRLLGAKIGADTVIHSKIMPVCTDLLSIDTNTILSKDSIVNGYTARSNCIHIGPVHIGSNAIVGEAGVLDINTTMEDDTQLGTASSLYEGQRIPQGKHYHGTPSQETTADYCAIDSMPCTLLRRWTYAIVVLLAGVALLPVPVLILYKFFPVFYELVVVPQVALTAPGPDLLLLGSILLGLSLAIFLIGGILGLLYIGIVPRLLNMFLEKDKVYVLYGPHYFIHQMIVATSNSMFFNRLFGDSSAIVHYLRWVGYRLNKIVQTGSNFGMSQKHDNPFLCDIGSGTIVSGGLKMVNETMSATSFKIGLVRIAENNYLGNYLHFPADAKVGMNVLLGTKMLVPIDGPERENIGLLGSPSFDIPRATERDKKMSNQLIEMDDATRKQQLQSKNRYNLRTAILYLASDWIMLFGIMLIGTLAFLNFPRYGLGTVFASAAAAFAFTVLWFWFVERASLNFSKLSPHVVPILDNYFWFHERVWKVTGLWLIAPAFSGTPFKNLFSRLEGVNVGRKIFDDGCYFDEYSLIEIGDYTNLNAACVIQPHSLEEAVFKSGRVKIGTGCTLGCASNLHYDVTIGDYSILETNSFLMKGEIMDPDAVWRGNPARAFSGSVGDTEEQGSNEGAVQVKMA